MAYALFENLCPNCGGTISVERLYLGLPCEACIPKTISKAELCSEIRSGNFKIICDIDKKVKNWEDFFTQKVGTTPWALQKLWAKKIFLKRSFALLAPTGIGKTTFGILTAFFLSLEGKKSYIILPTKLLVHQVKENLLNFGISEKEVLVAGTISGKEKNRVKERLNIQDFQILISTSMYLYKNFELIPKGFDFIFIDDVDSFLKTAKNIDKVLQLLGYSEEDIDKAYHLIQLKGKRKKTEEDWKEIERLSEEVAGYPEKSKGVLVVSSATANPRSKRVKLFKEMLGFEVGTATFFLRNIIDVFEEGNSFDLLVKRVKELGKGGLIFVSSDYGKEGIKQIIDILQREGIQARSYEEKEAISEFEMGKCDVVVGISSFRNPLARGLDLPHVVRYALFYGVPKIIIRLDLEANVLHLFWALISIRPIIEKHLKDYLRKLDFWIQKLKKISSFSHTLVEENSKWKEQVEELKKQILEFLTTETVRKLIEESEEITLKKQGDTYFFVIADVTGYLQASGRTSRLYPGGLTKGLSYILVDDSKAFHHLIKKVKWFDDDIHFTKSSELDLKFILKEIDKEREKVRELKQGRKPVIKNEYIKPILVIVESPNKMRTIANFFGKPISRWFGKFEVFEVITGNTYLILASTLGHILDVILEGGFHGIMVKDGNFIPVYEVLEGKGHIVEGLRKIATEIETVYLATDPDTEGEKISWDVGALLSPYVKEIKRMKFHEVTKKAILSALYDAGDIDENLVNAQIVRRIADRWVGFEVSELLQSTFHKHWLSGGRVQIPVLGWVIEREKEHRKKKYLVSIFLREEGKRLRLDFEFLSKQEAKKFYQDLMQIEIEVVEEGQAEIYPSPPFTTDTLLRKASEQFHFGAQKTMDLAQELFEKGYITYHRTDSTRVSDIGISIAKDYIKEVFSEDLFHARRWGQGGAHECIRPTKSLDRETLKTMLLSRQIQELSKEHILLYDLIFKQFIASQMKPVRVKSKRVKIRALDKTIDQNLHVEILENGFNLVFPVELHPDLSGIIEISDQKRFEIRAFMPLYTQGSLVQEMKKRGIGRPSTYAITIEKLLERGYIREVNHYLVPTKLGKEVYGFLEKQEKIMSFVSEEFTRELEHFMDEIQEGKISYQEVLQRLYEEVRFFKDGQSRVGI